MSSVPTPLPFDSPYWKDWLEAINSTVLVGLAVVDTAGRQVFVNQRFSELVGWAPEELIGLEPPFPYWPTDTGGANQQALEKSLAGTWPHEGLDLEFVHRDGHRIAIVMFASEVRVHGKVIGFAANCIDVSARRAAERRAREAETLFEILSAHSPEVIYVSERPSRELRFVSPAYERVWGSTIANLRANPRDYIDAIIPEDRERVRAQFEFREGPLPVRRTEYRIRRPDGTERWIWDQTIPVKDESGIVTRVVGIAADITERKQLELTLKRSEAQYRLLFTDNPEPMWVYDTETTHVLVANTAAVALLGYPHDELCGMSILGLADGPPEQERARRALAADRRAPPAVAARGIWRLLRRDGTPVDVELNSNAITYGGRPARVVLAKDVTSQLRAQRELAASEDRYRSLFLHATDAIVLLDSDDHFLAANPEAVTLFGYSAHDFQVLSLADIQEDPAGWRREDRHSATRLSSGKRSREQVRLRRHNGTVFEAEVTIRALTNGTRIALIRDLTEEITSRRRLQRLSDLYQLLADCNEVSAHAANRTSLLERLARVAVDRGRFLCAWIGQLSDGGLLTPVASGSANCVKVLSEAGPAGPPCGRGPIVTALATGQTVIIQDFQSDPRTADWHAMAASLGIGSAAALPLKTRGGVSDALVVFAAATDAFDAHVVATLERVTANVSYAFSNFVTQDELDESRHLMMSVIDASDAVIYAFDLEGRAILMNKAAADLFQTDRFAAIGKHRGEILSPPFTELGNRQDADVLKAGRPCVFHDPAPDQRRAFLLLKYPLRDLTGRIHAIGAVATDVTALRDIQAQLRAMNEGLERKVAERTAELAAARDRAEAADRTKAAFLSSVSHELRSPLHSILGYTSLLLDEVSGTLLAPQREHLAVVHDSAHHLLRIINDLLDISKIEAGALTVEPCRFVLRDAIGKVMQRFALEASKKHITLALNMNLAESIVVADPQRLDQILSNLISNAIKFTDVGGSPCRSTGRTP